MEKNNLISIILPVHNGEKYLSQSIESCLNQTYKNIELIIVNDCSTDSTLDIVNQYAALDDRVRIINNEENKKLPASLNIGHNQARGGLISWTSDDNIYELDAFEELNKSLFENNVDIVYSDIALINKDGEKIIDFHFVGFENIIFGNFIGSCFLYKKEVFDRNQGYDENLFLIEDYDFWLRAIIHSSYFQVKKILYNYRKHEDSLTSKINNDIEAGELFRNNIKKTYNNFCKKILEKDYEVVADFLTNVLTRQVVSYEWLIKHNVKIKNFEEHLLKNINFSNIKLLKRVFFKKKLEIWILNKSPENIFLQSLFLIKNNFYIIDKNSFKIIIKYSFFKLSK
ncbi:glycosyltransferase family 2 protein [Flavobacterium xinjiangense]|uniref:Glycosyltransferase involved in cell wall bisynthesis n=1 Tax=Flavobacterium xinjiangense TaxID=178356 RepID=A0A1M7MVN1_9FLAO|nr:glycosyltransferase [Flavobacterium xinjiangense]SHM95227.1 Glycosyltransferase involved in cell wall bisynthesis [Flavobacterium xinjiangense]